MFLVDIKQILFRTIFVSPENAFNIPERYKFAKASKKIKKGGFKKTKKIKTSSEKSSYDSPISSYDAPIAPSRKEESFGDFFSEASLNRYNTKASEEKMKIFFFRIPGMCSNLQLGKSS